LVNEYLPGQGIMPHEDGGAYYPVVATVSLGGTVVLDVTAKMSSSLSSSSLGDDGQSKSTAPSSWRILQEPRSLLVTTKAAYTETLHGIAEVHEDVDLGPGTVANWDLLGDDEAIRAAGGINQRTTRISLTYRDVLKVSSLGSKVFGRTR
jgi:alkylated DNA repair protein alkB family protein 6